MMKSIKNGLFKSLIFIFLILPIFSSSQDFPPPQNLHINFDNYNVFLLTWDAPSKELAYYKIFKDDALIDSTANTFHYDSIYFSYSHCYGVSAVYLNPNGESEKVEECLVVPALLELPFFENFENNTCFLGNNSLNGMDLWQKTEENSYSGNFSLTCSSDIIGEMAILFTPPIDYYQYENFIINFWYKIPIDMEKSDTLKILINNNLQIAALSNTNVWNYFETETTELDQFKLKGISNLGGGIYIDDLHLDVITSVYEPSKDNNSFNYPNPFTENTHITIENKFNTSDSKIIILNLRGQIVFKASIPNSANTFIWEGNDLYGNQVEKGLYFYRFCNELTCSKLYKMVKN